MPSLAANWLIPRLGSLRRLHPQLDVRVQVAPGLTDFAREDVDVAIRSGHGRYPGLRVDFLMDETFFPVCSAALLGDPARPLREPADLKHHTLLHEDVEPGSISVLNWPQWLAAIGVTGDRRDAGPALLAHLSRPAGGGLRAGRRARDQRADRRRARGRPPRPPLHRGGQGAVPLLPGLPGSDGRPPNVAAFRDWLFAEVGLGPAHATAAA